MVLPGAVVATDQEPVWSIAVSPTETKLAIARVESGDTPTIFRCIGRPISAAHSVNMPSPRLRNAAFGPRSFTQDVDGVRTGSVDTPATAVGGGESERWSEVGEQAIQADLEEPHRAATMRDEEAVPPNAAPIDRRHAATGGEVAEVRRYRDDRRGRSTDLRSAA